MGGHNYTTPLNQVAGRSFLHCLVGTPLDNTGIVEVVLLQAVLLFGRCGGVEVEVGPLVMGGN